MSLLLSHPSPFPSSHTPLWADAVNLLLSQSIQSVHCADSEGSWESRGDHDGDDIKRSVDGLLNIVVLDLLYRDGVTEPTEGWGGGGERRGRREEERGGRGGGERGGGEEGRREEGRREGRREGGGEKREEREEEERGGRGGGTCTDMIISETGSLHLVEITHHFTIYGLQDSTCCPK